MRSALLAVRAKRRKPLLDTKIITSWNALMIRALAHAGEVLAKDQYIAAAGLAADFLLTNHVSSQGVLWRTSRDGVTRHAGFLDDYAFLADALLALAKRAPGRREQAERIALSMIDRFADPQRGGFYFSAADADDLIVRQKVATDSPLPSGNAIAARVMLQLGRSQWSAGVIAAFARQIEENGEGMSALIESAFEYLQRVGPLDVAPGAVVGERPGSSPQRLANSVVIPSAAWENNNELIVTLKILEPFHINAHEPTGELIATRLAVSGDDDVATIDYPPGEQRRFAFSQAPLRVYAESVEFAVRFKSDMSGRPPIELALTYQACNDDACLPPVTKRFDVPAPLKTQ
jgi:hypothetical protein